MFLSNYFMVDVWKMRVSHRYLFLVVFASLLFACMEEPVSGNKELGLDKAARCGACHGLNGISNIPIIPNLAGQKAEYTALQLKAFRSGERLNAAMTPHAKLLSDQDIADLSAYYANLDPSGKASASP